MQKPRLWVHTSHYRTEKYRRGVERKKRRQDLKWIRRAEEILFLVEDQLLEGVAEFKYLGRVLGKTGINWPAPYSNLENTRKYWGHFNKILGGEGAYVKILAYSTNRCFRPSSSMGQKHGCSLHPH